MNPWPPALLAAALLLAPELGEACSVCFSASEANRKAFLLTTVFMTFLPLGMVAGVAWWLWRRVLRAERGALGDASPAQPAAARQPNAARLTSGS